MDIFICGEDIGSVDGEGSAGEVGDFSACFVDEEVSGGRIPGVEAVFPESVEAAAGDISEIQGG